MREILFRGKRIDNGEWVEGAFLNDRDGAFYICPAAVDISISYGDNGNRRRIGCWFNVDPSTVGQYTGLTDKNGKRIFEGDVVKWVPAYGVQTDVVSFDEGGFCAGNNFLQAGLYSEEFEGEAIGNIHDNPELLKEEPT